MSRVQKYEYRSERTDLVLIKVDLDGLQLRHLGRNVLDVVLGQVEDVELTQRAEAAGKLSELIGREVESAQGFEVRERGGELRELITVQHQRLQLPQLPHLSRETGCIHTYIQFI